MATPGSPEDVAVANGMAYVADGSNGLVVLVCRDDVFADGFETGTTLAWFPVVP